MINQGPTPTPRHQTPDLPRAVAWAMLKAAYTPAQLALLGVSEHSSERALNDAVRSPITPPDIKIA